MFVGDKAAGKSSLIQVFLNQSGKKEASSPLEYFFGRKPSLVDGTKELAHLYEVGGGKPFCDLIKTPIGAEQFPNTVAVIVLDLSQLNTLLDNLLFWIKTIKKQLEALAKGTSEGSSKDINDKLWSAHEDKKYINPVPLPILIVANKYDLFIKEDPYSFCSYRVEKSESGYAEHSDFSVTLMDVP